MDNPQWAGVDVTSVLRVLPQTAADDVDQLVDVFRRDHRWLGAASVYLADYQEVVLTGLVPAADSSGSDRRGGELSIAGTLAGRAFVSQQALADQAGAVWWFPLTNRWRRIGVLRVDLASPDARDDDARDDVRAAGHDLAALLATVIDSATRCTDLFARGRRRAPIALSAEMQWELLPPSCIAGPAVTLAGRLEPAYEVAGDCFDYALNGDAAQVGIFDPLGHDLTSTLLATLAVGVYRHGRRSGSSLDEIAASIDDTLRQQFGAGAFLTGQLAELDVVSGKLRWTNAGHPLPLLLRDRQVHPLELRPDPPWGLGHEARTVDQVDLQPGDHVLFYTDGIVEARSADGREFGLDHLADLLVRESLAEFAAPELLRRILQAVMDHRGDHLADDATAVLVSWRGKGELAELGG